MRGLPIVVLLAAGCAAGPAPRAPLPPAALAQLEQEARTNTADVATRVRLGAAYRDAERYADAVTVLEAVVADAPDNAGAHFLLGLTREDTGDWTGARAAYERYIAVGTSADVRNTVERRLSYVHRREVEQSVRQLAEAERTDAAAGPPEPGTLAVFPFVFTGGDETLRPLGRALAELLVTDLSQTDRLRVLERVRVQMLLDELEFGQSAWVDESTAARSGRRLRAATVVQGSIGGAVSQLELGAFAVHLDRESPRTPVTHEDRLDRFFDLEKQLALSLYAALGIELTVAERERVMQRPTENINALLAFGLGLEAEDRGEYETAAREYERAATIDPGFTPAVSRGEEATAVAEAERATFGVLVEQLAAGEGVELPASGSGEAPASPSTPGASAAVAAGVSFAPTTTGPGQIGGLPDPFHRDSGVEVLGREGIGARTLLRIIFIRPAG